IKGTVPEPWPRRRKRPLTEREARVTDAPGRAKGLEQSSEKNCTRRGSRWHDSYRERPKPRREGKQVQASLHYLRGLRPPAARDQSDRQLLQRFAALRDEAAFALLVERHGGLVYGVCRRLLRHAQDAEDAFQAAFLVLARKAGTIPWRDDVGNWLYAV